MRRTIFYIFFLTFINTIAYSQENITTFILTRHAEKGNDGTKDPDLSAVGTERAQSLMNLLQKTKVDAIYSTNYKRTRNTVAPLAQAKKITAEVYESFKGEEIDEMLRKYSGGTIVIAGHSNDIPWMANYLIGKEEFKTFDDTDYHNLLVISVVKKGMTSKVTWLAY